MELLAKQVQGLQNIYTPFPFTVHLIFCIIATIVYIAQYTRKKSIHYLLIMLAIDATFVTQICTSEIIITCLFILEAALLIAAAIFSHQYSKSLKAEKISSAEDKTDDNTENEEK